MFDFSHEHFYAELYRGFLALAPDGGDTSAAANRYRAWLAAAVPVVCPHDGEDNQDTLLSVVAAEEPHKHTRILGINLFVRLQVLRYLAPDEANPDGIGTPPETVSEWLKPLQQRLFDAELFRTYLLTLSQSDRATRQIQLRRPWPQWRRVDDGPHTIWEMQINHHILVGQFNPPD